MEAGRYQKRPPQIYYSQSSVYEDQVCSQSLSASGSTIHSPVSIINLKASRSAPNLPFFTLPQQVYTALMQPIHILMCWEVCIPPNISCNYHKSFQEAWFAIGPSDLLGLFSRIPLPLQKKAVVYMLDNMLLTAANEWQPKKNRKILERTSSCGGLKLDRIFDRNCTWTT